MYEDDPIYQEYYKREVENSQLEEICDANHLHEAYLKSRKGTAWKESVQRYGMNELIEIRNSQKAIRSGKYKQKPIVEFELKERGHDRDIKSHHISDRVIQRSLNDHILLPRVRDKLIYDNGASLEGKGLSFSRSRFEIDLRNSYKEFGPKGIVVLIDFSKYFDNIIHYQILQMLYPLLNPAEFVFMQQVFREFEIDVSYMDDEEFAGCMNKLFNSLEYAKIDKSLLTGEKFMQKSVGIGSQTSQITGLLYPHQLDNYCKIVRGLKHYGRYMDDTYFMCRTYEEAIDIYNNICYICAQLGIFINPLKTRILNLDNWISYLKINYWMNPNTGRLIRKVNAETFRREHRRLKKFQIMYCYGKMSFDDILNCYKSWRGTYLKFDSGYEILAMDNYFRFLFGLSQDFDVSGKILKSIKNGSIKRKEI